MFIHSKRHYTYIHICTYISKTGGYAIPKFTGSFTLVLRRLKLFEGGLVTPLIEKFKFDLLDLITDVYDFHFYPLRLALMLRGPITENAGHF